ncbi:MAG: PqqD family protein [Bacteriovoracia bacterium]
MKFSKISEATQVRKSKNVHWKSVDGEAVLLHFGSGDYFALDRVGTHLWSVVAEKPKTVKDLIESLRLEYDCELEQAKKDTLEFCGQLLAERLLEFQE